RSSPTTEVNRTCQGVARMQEVCPKAILFGGGAHLSSAVGDRAARRLGLDFAVYGEGEMSALEVCRRIRDQRDYRDVTGIMWRGDDGRIVKNPATSVPRHLD